MFPAAVDQVIRDPCLFFQFFRFLRLLNRRPENRDVAKKPTFKKTFAFPLEQIGIENDWLSLQVLNYGAIIQRLKLRTGPRGGKDLVCGKAEPGAYLKDTFSMGACVGRFAGRLSGGLLRIDGKSYPLPHKDGVTLHGGECGFGRQYWRIASVRNGGPEPEVRLEYESPHLEEGFPGNVLAAVTYRLSGPSLVIRHQATTDRPTVVNLTNHSYFRLDRRPGISHYQLQLGASRYLETDGRLVPSGRLLSVEGTEYDFLEARGLAGCSLDTPFALDPGGGPCARVYSPVSGIRMTVTTDQPALVVFTPGAFPAICLETQNYPDAPNHALFPSAVLRPGETYINESRFTFEDLSEPV